MTILLALIGCIFLIAILVVLVPALVIVLWYAVEILITMAAVWGLVKLVRYLCRKI